MHVRTLLAAAVGLVLLGVPGASTAATTGIALTPCGGKPLIECGSISVPLYWSQPGAGKPLTVKFRVYRHTDQSAPAGEPVVAFEGGPGYPSIGSAESYLFMLGPLHRTHDLIVMDQRGTGGSSVIDCPALQNGIGVYSQAAAACARQLGVRAGAFGTAAVGDDLAAILRGLDVPTVDVYGDSYGTYAAQVFTIHHPGMVRAVVLDGSYDNSFRPFEQEESVSLRHAWRALCARSGACHGILRSIGAFDRSLRTHPFVGRGLDADGFAERVHLTPALFAQLVEDATFSYTFFRDLPGALAALHHGYRAPMLRLAAEDASFDAAGGGAAGYSVGDYAAVSCHDYPTVWNVDASPAQRRGQLDRAVARLPERVFAPFSKRTWLASLDENQLVYGCLGWPVPPVSDPPFPSHARPHIPVLVLDGEFDQATPVADARHVAAAWPDSTYVQVRNTGHISALGDYQGCASGIVRRFLADLHAGNTSCAGRMPAIGVSRFPASLAASPAARSTPGDRSAPAAHRGVWVAGATVGDALARWYNLMYGVDGHGLRGGAYTVAGGYYSHLPLVIRMRGDRFVSGLAVSGTATWNRSALRVRAVLTLRGPAAASGRIVLTFPTDRQHGTATATGVLGGRRVAVALPVPWVPQG
ncbi:MAG TPA: alpha/beta fold hydrolase [Gaiellales bacterium]